MGRETCIVNSISARTDLNVPKLKSTQGLTKEGCNRGHGHGFSAAFKLGAPELAVYLQTDLQPVKQNLCLAPVQKWLAQKRLQTI